MICELFKVRIRPRRMRIFVKAGGRPIIIPSQAEPIRINRCLADQSVATLLNKRLLLIEHEFVEKS
jgi:hypothetical protein